MSYKEMDFSPTELIVSFLNVIAYIISPILFIWAVNTLFECEIPMTFKTWLAGFVLIMLLKFHLRGTDGFHENAYEGYDEYGDDEYDDEYDDDDYNDDRDMEDRKAKLKAKLIAYHDRKNKKTPPTDES